MVEDQKPALWRVYCHVRDHPGQWQYWFREQICAVGYAPNDGYHFEGESLDLSWTGARNALHRMREGDWIIVSLPKHRVARLGRIFQLAVDDSDWNPVIPPRAGLPHGDNGRRILVRWELGTGPSDPTMVVVLPSTVRFSTGMVRATIRRIPLERLDALRAAMKDERNWVPIIGAFAMESALSDYIALHPEQLEAGMISHAGLSVRELVMPGGIRLDVLLQDRSGMSVLVECKQHAASVEDIDQLANYRRSFLANPSWCSDGVVRSILVHGGGSRVSPAINDYAESEGIELVYHQLKVSFFSSGC